MEPFIAIDPGRSVGFALFRKGELSKFTRQIDVARAWRLRGPQAVVCEMPVRRYHDDDRPMSERDLVISAVRAGVQASLIPGYPRYFIPANVWKKSVKKSVMTSRIRKGLTDAERGKLNDVPASHQGDVLDAIGLGKWWARKIQAGLDPNQFLL